MRKYSSTAIKTQLEVLKSRHLSTSKVIKQENSRRNPDPFLLQELKRTRLKLKDQITGHAFI